MDALPILLISSTNSSLIKVDLIFQSTQDFPITDITGQNRSCWLLCSCKKGALTTLLRKCPGSQNPENEELFIREPYFTTSVLPVLRTVRTPLIPSLPSTGISSQIRKPNFDIPSIDRGGKKCKGIFIYLFFLDKSLLSCFCP